MALTDAQLSEFRARGFVHAGRVLTDEQTTALKGRLDDVLAGRSSAKPEASRNLLGEGAERVVIQVVNIWEADDLFRAHLFNPDIVGMAAQLMGTDVVRVWHDQIQVKPPLIGGPTQWHQDHPYWPIIEPADLVSAWVALEDADVDNGCMWMVPGSHTWGPYKDGTVGTDPNTYMPAHDPALLPAGVVVEPEPCPVKAGEAMFHHCMTWHGAPVNNTTRSRPAIAVHYMPGWTRYVPKHGHMVEHRVTVGAGDILEGEYFPQVWDHGPIAAS